MKTLWRRFCLSSPGERPSLFFCGGDLREEWTLPLTTLATIVNQKRRAPRMSVSEIFNGIIIFQRYSRSSGRALLSDGQGLVRIFGKFNIFLKKTKSAPLRSLGGRVATVPSDYSQSLFLSVPLASSPALSHSFSHSLLLSLLPITFSQLQLHEPTTFDTLCVLIYLCIIQYSSSNYCLYFL